MSGSADQRRAVAACDSGVIHAPRAAQLTEGVRGRSTTRSRILLFLLVPAQGRSFKLQSLFTRPRFTLACLLSRRSSFSLAAGTPRRLRAHVRQTTSPRQRLLRKHASALLSDRPSQQAAAALRLLNPPPPWRPRASSRPTPFHRAPPRTASSPPTPLRRAPSCARSPRSTGFRRPRRIRFSRCAPPRSPPRSRPPNKPIHTLSP